MNQRIAGELTKLRNNLIRLETLLTASHEEAVESLREREKLIQEQWRLRRDMATLERNAEDYDQLQRENESLARRTTEVRDGLQNLLGWSKALGGELRK